MNTLSVNLTQGRSYPIWITPSLLGHLHLLYPHLINAKVMIVASPPVADQYLSSLKQMLSAQNVSVDAFLLPDGETAKTLATVERLITALIESGHDRTTTLIALGGGVTGDIVGFVAAIYLRGVNFIQIPTTLLAQVDSSVGGKTGVNHPLAKNMTGAFYQPQAVLIALDVLKTLPDREFVSGLAEVVKYGLIADAVFFDWLIDHAKALLVQDPEALDHAIFRSCQIKAQVVSEDEKETGRRAILNLGHTFGHALEAGLGYGQLLHGEAVSVGMLMAVDLSYRMGFVSEQLLNKTEHLLTVLGLPTGFSASLAVSEVITLMSRDKKVQHGQLRLVLLKACGEAFVTADFDWGLLGLVISKRGVVKTQPV